MDGHFVPNISIGPQVIKSLHRYVSEAYLDCHLMVSEPGKWIEPLQKAGAHRFTFHVEATEDPAALIAAIRAAGMDVGVALKPGTPLEAIEAFGDKVDLVLVMTVEPGFSGQSFMHDVMPKVAEARARYPSLQIQVDGGLGPDTVDAAAKAGANTIVSASAIYKSDDKRGVIRALKESVERYGHGKGL